jgi:beta-galactosidase/evolved beta-galactosidase subunit alpha
MTWDVIGGGFNFDALSLLGEKNEVVWSIGSEDDSSADLKEEWEVQKLEEPVLDSIFEQGSDGFLDPYRNPGPEAPSVVYNYAPVRIESIREPEVQDSIWLVRLENRMSFTDLQDCPSQWRIQVWDHDSPRMEYRQGPSVDLRAQANKDYQLDLSFLEEFKEPVTAVEWAVLPPESMQAAPAELGCVGLNLSLRPPRYSEPSGQVIHAKRQDDMIELKGDNWKAVFDESAGALVHYEMNDVVLIDGPVRTGLWRPPMTHEYTLWGHRRLDHWEQELKQEPERQSRHVWVESRPGEVKITFSNAYSLPGQENTILEGLEDYRMDTSGRILLSGAWRWTGEEGTQLRRLGFDMELPGSLQRLIWSGPGPENTYSDRMKGYPDRIHVLNRDAKDTGGNKTDVRWMRWLEPGSGHGLTVIPKKPADCEPSVNEGMTLLRIGRARGCGNKYWPPVNEKHLLTMRQGMVYRQTLEIKGF